jgi:ankyrin repeat protein
MNLSNLTCPLTLNIYKIPVTLETGVTYEQDAIEEWLAEHNTCPKTLRVLTSKKYYPSLIVKEFVEQYLKEHPEEKESQYTRIYSFIQKDKLSDLLNYDMIDNQKIINNQLDQLYDLFSNYKNISYMKHYLEKSIGLNSINLNKKIYLVHIILEKILDEKICMELLEILSKREINWSIKDNLNCSPIHYACKHSPISIIDFIIKKGVNLEVEGHLNWRPIHYACRSSKNPAVDLLISNGVNLECNDNIGRRPIHLACLSSNLHIVNTLKQNGANMESEDYYGSRPIHYACKHAKPEIVKALIDFKVNLECADSEGYHPIHLACLFIQANAKILINHGVNLEVTTIEGERPIHNACKSSFLDIVELLIDHGINLEVLTKKGESPILIACTKKNSSIVKLLIDQQVSLSTVNNQSLLLLACENHTEDIILYMIDKGVDLTEYNKIIEILKKRNFDGLVDWIKIVNQEKENENKLKKKIKI